MADGLVNELEGVRLTDLAQTLVQLIVRNLFEQTGRGCALVGDGRCALANLAGTRRGKRQPWRPSVSASSTASATVYLDLVLTDLKGRIIASANPDFQRRLVNISLAGEA